MRCLSQTPFNFQFISSLVKVELKKDHIRISFPYNPELVEKVKRITGRVFNPETKSWIIPLTSLNELEEEFPQMPPQFRQKVEELLQYQPTKIDHHHLARDDLYPHVLEGIHFLLTHPKSFLCDEMGLGKTIQTIGACEELFEHGKADLAIIFCPATIKWTVWAKEIKVWAPESPFVVLDGGKKEREELWRKDARYYVVNYELVYNPLDFPHILRLTRGSRAIIVLDECTRIKSWKTRTAQQIKQLQAPYKWCLTGTPVENRPEDIYSINQFLDNYALGTWSQFRSRYLIQDGYGTVVGYANLDDLHRRLSPFLLRRKKSDVLTDLPDKIEYTYEISLTPQETHDYNIIVGRVERLLSAWQEKHEQRVYQDVLSTITLSRMYLDHPLLVHQSQSQTAAVFKHLLSNKHSSKMDELFNILDDVEGKVVIFSEFARMIHLLSERLQVEGIGHVSMHGGVPMRQRKQLIDTFNENQDTRVFLSTDAGKHGVSLVGGSVVINYDIPWNPATRLQRIDRLHRPGQKKAVNVIDLLVPDADKIERRVKEVLKIKEGLFSQVIEGEDWFTK